jgi:hypothetical protein
MYDYRDYLSFAKRLFQLAEEEESKAVDCLLVPSVLLAWIAIEALVNSMVDDFSSLPEDLFLPHERAFLLEKRLVLADKGKDLGTFLLDTRSEYRRVEEKIFFLIRKFSKSEADYKGGSLWQGFQQLKEVRNRIAHPRTDDALELSLDDVEKHLKISEEVIKFISTRVWGKAVSI